MITLRRIPHRKHALSACFLIFILCTLSGCKRNPEPVTRTDFVLDTVATVTVYDIAEKDRAEHILNEAFSEIRRYEKLFSAEIGDSDVAKINRAKGEKTVVSPETAELIGIALKYSELSDGAFDITIRPVSGLWDFKDPEAVPPDKADIEEALTHVGYEKIVLDEKESSVFLSDSEAEIDLGGIAKGYIADKVKEFLIENGVGSAIINLGGNVLLIGSKPGNVPFSVGIEKPFSGEQMIMILEVSDVSMVTSGNYERYFKYKDKLYHHILDTKTGYPVENGLNSVTVLTDRSVDGDALSTAFFCVGSEGAAALEEKLKEQGIEVKGLYFIDDKDHIEVKHVNAP